MNSCSFTFANTLENNFEATMISETEYSHQMNVKKYVDGKMP